MNKLEEILKDGLENQLKIDEMLEFIRNNEKNLTEGQKDKLGEIKRNMEDELLPEIENLEKSMERWQPELGISDVTNNDLINQIKKCKEEVIDDMEVCGYPMEAPLIQSLVHLIKLIDRL